MNNFTVLSGKIIALLRRRFGMLKNNKKIKSLFILGLFLLAFVFTGCKSTKLADCYDEQHVKDTAIDIINDVQVRGAKTVLEEKMRDDFIDKIDLDEMDGSCKSYVSGIGNFLAYTQKTVIGKHYDDTDEDFAVILVTATYEDGEVNYTLTFDKDMNLVGFYPKN